MKIAIIISFLVTRLALNAQTIQGKVVRVADGETNLFLRYTHLPTKEGTL